VGFGVALAGTAADGAALTVLVESVLTAALVEAPWQVALAGDGAGSVLVSPAFTQAVADALALRGLDGVALAEVDGALVGTPVRDGHAGFVWKKYGWRAPPRRIWAVRPRAIAVMTNGQDSLNG
jgi:hypothetical protein